MNRNVEILLEDSDLLVVNKPAGVLTIPGRQGGESIREVLERQSGREQDFRIVHRLDRETSGVLVLAKTVDAQRALSDQFFKREVEKQYLALVRGGPEDDSGMIHAAIGPHPTIAGRMLVDAKKGKAAQTRWRVVERLGVATLLRCWPLTGRQHQIRVHLQLMGMPLLVDSLYGSAERFYLSTVKSDYHRSSKHDERPLIARLTLHAEAITFRHPISGQAVRIEAPLPKDFRATLTQLRKSNQPHPPADDPFRPDQ